VGCVLLCDLWVWFARLARKRVARDSVTSAAASPTLPTQTLVPDVLALRDADDEAEEVRPVLPPLESEWPLEIAEMASSDGSRSLVDGSATTSMDLLQVSGQVPLRRPAESKDEPIDPRVLGSWYETPSVI